MQTKNYAKAMELNDYGIIIQKIMDRKENTFSKSLITVQYLYISLAPNPIFLFYNFISSYEGTQILNSSKYSTGLSSLAGKR